MDITVVGLEELRLAVARNPQKILSEVGKFLSRGIAEYNRGVLRNPWNRGNSGGGAPVSTENLRDTHQKEIQRWQARIYTTAPYASYVHDGTKKMPSRPWLDYVKDTSDPEIIRLQDQMLQAIVEDLAK